MLDILKDLNATPGVKGSAVVMGDGVVMASLLATGSDSDSFAALMSSLFSNLTKNASKIELGSVRRLMVTASRGCFAAVCLGNAWLAAELEIEIDPTMVELELESAAGRLRRALHVRGSSEAPAALPAESAASQTDRPTLAPPGAEVAAKTVVAATPSASARKNQTPLVS